MNAASEIVASITSTPDRIKLRHSARDAAKAIPNAIGLRCGSSPRLQYRKEAHWLVGVLRCRRGLAGFTGRKRQRPQRPGLQSRTSWMGAMLPVSQQARHDDRSATTASKWTILVRLLVGLVVFFSEGIQKLAFPRYSAPDGLPILAFLSPRSRDRSSVSSRRPPAHSSLLVSSRASQPFH